LKRFQSKEPAHTKKAQTLAIRCLGSPQATILYGESAPNALPIRIVNALCFSEVVIQTAIEQICLHHYDASANVHKIIQRTWNIPKQLSIWHHF